jgi:hypothetical protein
MLAAVVNAMIRFLPATVLLADVWTLHGEPCESPSLHHPPGELYLGMSVSSLIPGVDISWSM